MEDEINKSTISFDASLDRFVNEGLSRNNMNQMIHNSYSSINSGDVLNTSDELDMHAYQS